MFHIQEKRGSKSAPSMIKRRLSEFRHTPGELSVTQNTIRGSGIEVRVQANGEVPARSQGLDVLKRLQRRTRA
jgi:hypothetical protein